MFLNARDNYNLDNDLDFEFENELNRMYSNH